MVSRSILFNYARVKKKAAAELGLSFLAYIMKRAKNIVGVKRLIAAMR
jgi:hypothetical protein